ncbi:MAG: hypothetical protein HY841_06700 [Bacteroidetes bacterium]|nr:hypothetical protein [Bacteroidota bacterium]
MPGYHIEWNSKRNNPEEKQTARKENTQALSGQAETETVFNEDVLSADNNSDIQTISFKKKPPVVFSEPPLILNENKSVADGIIITKRGDTIHCKIIRETSVRIYYVKNEVSVSQDSAMSKVEQSILRTDVASYNWDSKAKTDKQMQENNSSVTNKIVIVIILVIIVIVVFLALLSRALSGFYFSI